VFETHKLNESGFAEMHLYKQTMTDAVAQCLAAMPEGREKSLFKTNIDQAVFWGAKAIASKTGNFDQIVDYTPKGAEVNDAVK
jgi:hypothetical protein